MIKLLGYSNGTSKKGNPFTVIHIAKEMSERDIENGGAGCKVSQEFLPQAQVGILKPSDIGREISLDYEVNSGRAYLVSVGFVK